MSEAVRRYREAVATCTDPDERETAYWLLSYALDLALEHGDRSIAESVVAELRQCDAPLETQLAAEAQLLGRTGSADAAAKYQYMSYVGQQSPNNSANQELFRLARAGLTRIRHRADWQGCTGLLIRRVDDPRLPVEVGDIVLRVQGQCVLGIASLLRAGRQAGRARELPIELWRNDELLRVTVPGGKVPFFASPF